jgi:hypothetical protein
MTHAVNNKTSNITVIPGQRTSTPLVRQAQPSSERDPVTVVYDPADLLTASLRRVMPARRGTGYLPYRYDVSGMLTLGSDIPLRELDFFHEPRLGRGLDIEVRVGKVGGAVPRTRARLVRFEQPPGLRYEEHLGRFGANFSIDLGDQIRVTVSSLLARSPHVVYTNIIEALLRYAFAARGVMLLHSACVELDGRGVMLSARTDTGKTGTVLRLLRERGARFLSDDMTILHPDGTARCFPKPMTISSHTLRAVDPGDLSFLEWKVLGLKSRLHSKSGRGVGMRIGEQNLPVMTANAITQMLIPPPKYGADRLVPCEVVDWTCVRDLFVIERGDPRLEEMSEDEAAAVLLANTDDAYGFPPYRYVAPALLIGGEEYASLRAQEERVLRSALSHVRVRRMASDSFSWADGIPRLLAEADD